MLKFLIHSKNENVLCVVDRREDDSLIRLVFTDRISGETYESKIDKDIDDVLAELERGGYTQAYIPNIRLVDKGRVVAELDGCLGKK